MKGFARSFPDGTVCRKPFREMREKEGVVCQHYDSHNAVWQEQNMSISKNNTPIKSIFI